MELCKNEFVLANGESVSPCHLNKNHEGDCKGYVLGSLCRWSKEFHSEEEMHHMAK